MPKNSPDRVLAVRFSALGDVAMTIPALYNACVARPRTQFIFVTRKSMQGLFVNAPANLEVVGLDLDQYKGLAGLRRLARDTVGLYKPGVVVDLHDVLRTKAMRLYARLRGVKTARIDKERSLKQRLTRHVDKVMLPLKSTIERYADAFAKAGIEAADSFQGLYPGGKADTSLFAAIADPKPEGATWIGVAPFAAHPGKIYPLDKMREVVKALASRPGWRVFVFGAGAGEQEAAEKWEAEFPSVSSLAGKRYGFTAELALLSHLDAMVSMDSANMHLASLAGAPVVSVWGATHSYCGFQGWRQPEENMVQLSLPCRPCSVFGNKPCARHDLLCLTGIRPETIIAKVDKIAAKEKECIQHERRL